jgi:hypothetical protein
VTAGSRERSRLVAHAWPDLGSTGLGLQAGLPPRYGVLERIGNPERWADRLSPVGIRNGGERLCIQRAR